MDYRKIINWIKIREQWRDAIISKHRASSNIWKGIYEFGTFLAYYSAENYFLSKEITELYERNPNFKYLFYISLFFGCLGIVNSLLGIYNYFESSQQIEQIKQQIEQIEKDLLN